MFRKILNYQNLLSTSFSRDCRNGKMPGGGMFFLLLVMNIICSVVFDCQMSSWMWLCVMLYGLGINLIENSSSRVLRTLPVSDAFAVAERLFVYPVYFGGMTFLVLFLVFVGLEAIMKGDFAFILNIWGMNGKGSIFSLMLAIGVWFWLCLGAFRKSKKVRTIWYITIYVLCWAGFWGMTKLAEKKGIFVSISLSDLPELIPNMPMLALGISFAVLSGMIAWRGCLKLYRADVKGQAGCVDAEDKMDEEYTHRVRTMTTKAGKQKRGMVLVLSVCILAGSMYFLLSSLGGLVDTGDGQSVDIETANPAEYEEWNSYAKEIHIDDDLWESGETIFPENMEEKYIEEYYAKIDGAFQNDDWSSIEKLRFMVVTLPEDTYKKEKARIAGISVTCEDEEAKGSVNAILHDSEHFPLEAYIAVYEDDCGYEYALTDDENKQIIYVFAYNAYLRDIPTKTEFRAKLGANVISIYDANTGAKGFSLYTFRNNEFGFEFTYTP